MSYLIASRVAKPKYALLVALVGLLPDVDALLGIHRWVTHSLVLTTLVTAVLILLTICLNFRYLSCLLVATILYILHLLMDLFTAPVPLLWPLTNRAYMLNIELDTILSTGGISITPRIVVATEYADFAPQPTIEGPLISTTGIIVAIGVVVINVVGTLKNRLTFGKQ